MRPELPRPPRDPSLEPPDVRLVVDTDAAPEAILIETLAAG